MKDKPIKASFHDDQETTISFLLLRMFKGLGFMV